MDFVAILSTGVSGFSFLMLYVGFKLTSSVQQRISDVCLQKTEPEKLEIWRKLADRQLTNTRYFMFFSVFMLASGLVVLQMQHRPEVSINLSVFPSDQSYLPAIRTHNGPIIIDENGSGATQVKSEHTIIVNNHSIYEELMTMRADLAASQTSERALSEQLAKSFSDAGFGRLASQ